MYGLFGNVYILVVCYPGGNSLSAMLIIEAVAASLASIRGGRWRKGSLELSAAKLMEGYRKTYKAVKKVLDAEGFLGSANFSCARRLSALSRSDLEGDAGKGTPEQARKLQEEMADMGERLQNILDEAAIAIDFRPPAKSQGDQKASPAQGGFDILGLFNAPAISPATQDPFKFGEAEVGYGFADFGAFGAVPAQAGSSGSKVDFGDGPQGWGGQESVATSDLTGFAAEDSDSDCESRQGESRFKDAFPAAFNTGADMFGSNSGLGLPWNSDDFSSAPSVPPGASTSDFGSNTAQSAKNENPSGNAWMSNNPFETAPEAPAPPTGPPANAGVWNLSDGSGNSWQPAFDPPPSTKADFGQTFVTLTETVRGRFEGEHLHSLGYMGDLILDRNIAASGAGTDFRVQTSGRMQLRSLSYDSRYLKPELSFHAEAYGFSVRQSLPSEVGSQPRVVQYVCGPSGVDPPMLIKALAKIAPDGSGLHIALPIVCPHNSNLRLENVTCTCYFRSTPPGSLEPVRTSPGGALWSPNEVVLQWNLGELAPGTRKVLRAFLRCPNRASLLEASRSVAARVRFTAPQKTASGFAAVPSAMGAHHLVVGDFEAVPKQLSIHA